MSPFDPLGEKARWRYVYDILQGCDIDDVVTYETLAESLELDPLADRHAIQMATRRAAREYEEVDKRAMESIPNVGYRVVQPKEHLRLAQQQQRRSGKALVKGRSKVVNVDVTALEPETRRAFETVARAFAMQMDINRRLDSRQRNLEGAVEAMAERHDRSEAELRELRDRLARLEEGRMSDGAAE